MATLHAPTDLATVRSFINTLDVDAGTDTLADAPTFAAWLAEAGLCSLDARVDADHLDRARELRGVLRRLAEANHDGTTDPDAVDRLSRVSARLAVGLRFTPDGGVELAAEDDGVDGALAAIVAATAAAMAEDDWRRLKLCGADDCAWAFYDESRNRSARWCSMAGCGNREKARKFRQRHEGGGATG